MPIFLGHPWEKDGAEPILGVLSQLTVQIPRLKARIAKNAAYKCDAVRAEAYCMRNLLVFRFDRLLSRHFMREGEKK